MFMMPALPGSARTRFVPPPQEMLALPCRITSLYAGMMPALPGSARTCLVPVRQEMPALPWKRTPRATRQTQTGVNVSENL